MANEEPDRVSIREADRKTYETILGRGSPLQGEENKVAFLIAMAMGFSEDRRNNLVPNKFGYVRTSYLTPDEKTIIKALAVHEKGGLDVLTNRKEVYSLAERFAAGGVPGLKTQATSGEYGSFEKRLEGKLVELASHVKKESPG